MVLMNLEEYAKHRGCSKVAVWKAIKKGRISANEKPGRGSRLEYEIDPISADAQWAKNTRLNNTAKIAPEGKVLKGRPTKEQSEAIRVVREAKAAEKERKKAKEHEKRLEVSIIAESSKRASGAGKTANPASQNEQRPLTFQERKLAAEVRKAEASAELAEIDLLKSKGILVVAEELEDAISERIAQARDSMLHMPKSFMVTFQEAPKEYSAWMEDFIKAVLSKISGIGGLDGNSD